MSNITAPNVHGQLGGSTGGGASAIGLATPEKYSSLGDFMSTINALDVRPELIKAYGNQGITGFLRMTGAVKAAGSAEKVTYYEEARLHQKVRATTKNDSSGAASIAANQTLVFVADANAAISTPLVDVKQNTPIKGDILLLNGKDRVVVTATSSLNSGTEFTVAFMNQPTTTVAQNNTFDMPVIGNIFDEGEDQPDRFVESNVVRYQKPYAIVKGNFEVSGSQATNIGYIDVGGGDYRWYIKGEMDARQRFLDKREMTLLFGQEVADQTNLSMSGNEGYITALEDRGLVTSGLLGNDGGFADLDDLIIEFDKQGSAPEYAIYANTAQNLRLDDMVAQGGGSSKAGIAGVTASYGAFQNSPDMAVQLGFSSFSRGGYTFHKHSWKLLNDPTLLGADADVQSKLVAGVMCPLATVTDPTTGDRSPALELNYKAAGGYSRELEHWVTGSILGFRNDTKDVAKFNYRSECALVTRAANQHVLIKA
jgi:hypothetical protein